MNISELRSRFQFVASSVKELDIKNSFVDFTVEIYHQCEIEVDYRYEGTFNTEDDRIRVGTVLLNVTVTLPQKEGSGRFKLFLSIQGCFSYNDPAVTEKDFEKMISTNGCASLYSIARGIILSVTSQIFADGRVDLPMINFMELYARKNAEPGK